MSKAAKQFVFDTALSHIRNQGCGSYGDGISPNQQCRYRDGQGNGCAFAPMIQEYDKKMEGSVASRLIDKYKDNLYPSAIEAGHNFCDGIQSCHDTAVAEMFELDIEMFELHGYDKVFMDLYEMKMKSFAEYYELEYRADTTQTPKEELPQLQEIAK